MMNGSIIGIERGFRFLALALALLLLIPASMYAQDAGAQTAGGDAPVAEQAAPDKTALPRRFREITLGMKLDNLKEALIKDKLFDFRGDRDVSFLPIRDQTLVETTGSSFVRRAFFQLRDGELFVMAFSLNTLLTDHYSVFTSLVQKYGQPEYLNPQEAVWETEDTRIALERPLTVKYIDKKVFDDIISESAVIESRQVRLRQEFLNEF